MQHQVLVVDDHALVRDGIRQLLVGEFRIVGEASSGAEARQLCQALPCDVVLLDSYLPGEDIEATLKELQNRTGKPLPVVLLLNHGEDDYTLTRALKAGVKGFVQKSDRSSVLLEALRAVVSGRTFISASNGSRLTRLLQNGARATIDLHRSFRPLSRREESVLRWIVQGKQTKEIAVILGLCETTVKTHRQHLMRKLRVSNLAELLHLTYREKLTVLDLDRA